MDPKLFESLFTDVTPRKSKEGLDRYLTPFGQLVVTFIALIVLTLIVLGANL